MESINEGKDIIVGLFYFLFRELVEGLLLIDIILENLKDEDMVIVNINFKDLSKFYVNKKVYFNKFKESNKIVIVV